MDPEVLLLDEPLGALDALTRGTLQDEIERIWGQDRKTVILITNDVDEGILLADRIIPLTAGPRATLGPVLCHRHRPTSQPQGIQSRSAIHALAKRSRRNSCCEQQPRRQSHRPTRAPPASRNGGRRMNPAVDRYLEFWRVSKSFAVPGSRRGRQRIRSDGPTRRIRFADRPFRLRQVDRSCRLSPGSIRRRRRNHSGRQEIDGAGPDRGVVFQSPSLLPWLTAFENVLLGVEQVQPRRSRREGRDRSSTICRWSDWATRCSSGRPNCRKECDSASDWRGRLRSIRRCCCSTNRLACSTRSRGSNCKTC